SLSAEAVIFPATITVIKDAQPDSTQIFSFSTSGAGLSSFQLDDDGNNANALSNTKVFSNIITFGTKTIVEAAVTGWSLTAIDITESETADSTFDVGTGTATLQVQEGENITVKYTSVQQKGSIAWEKRTDVSPFALLGGATFTITPNPLTGNGTLTVVDN